MCLGARGPSDLSVASAYEFLFRRPPPAALLAAHGHCFVPVMRLNVFGAAVARAEGRRSQSPPPFLTRAALASVADDLRAMYVRMLEDWSHVMLTWLLRVECQRHPTVESNRFLDSLACVVVELHRLGSPRTC